MDESKLSCDCGIESPKTLQYKNWMIKVEHHSNNKHFYRDRVIMYKEGNENKKIITIIMFNPGSFHSKESEINDNDSTLKNIMKAFGDSECKLEILNIYNVNEPKLNKLREDYSEPQRYNGKPIEKYLQSHKPGDSVFVQWGAEKDPNKRYAKPRFDRIRKVLKDAQFEQEGVLDIYGNNIHPFRWNGLVKNMGMDKIKGCIEQKVRKINGYN